MSRKKKLSVGKPVNLFTVGFTKKGAQQFFQLLAEAGVTKVIDTRLNNVSQLSGFAKKKDLEYFLRVIGNIEYSHAIDLAPTQDILTEYKKNKGEWLDYEKKFIDLLKERKIAESISPEWIEGACLLCSEAQPHHCHRRLVAEYLNDQWGNVKICHL